MRIEGRMTRNPVTISPHDLISKAEAYMQSGGFHLLPVVENGKLLGVLTKGDLTAHMNASQHPGSRSDDARPADHWA